MTDIEPLKLIPLEGRASAYCKLLCRAIGLNDIQIVSIMIIANPLISDLFYESQSGEYVKCSLAELGDPGILARSMLVRIRNYFRLRIPQVSGIYDIKIRRAMQAWVSRMMSGPLPELPRGVKRKRFFSGLDLLADVAVHSV